ncbi:hypothetical protein HWV07_10270 [Natronomonas salina]|uniref:hypothetical protein n=1 Tax=Natronomonas salina TaxID=1710540 RepID=UPI0015B6CF0A|nr:hypothetical protein [Natronomonas salina]QLD89393.1 hypothetical protein HWV07_10270 [Natronomonas salina]
MSDEPPTELHVLAGRLRAGVRRVVEHLAAGPVQERSCPECGASVTTEPTESSIRCGECALGERDG